MKAKKGADRICVTVWEGNVSTLFKVGGKYYPFLTDFVTEKGEEYLAEWVAFDRRFTSALIKGIHYTGRRYYFPIEGRRE